jgi:hypothetical protein
MTSSAAEAPPMSTARRLRIGVLLLVLAAVALDAWLTRSRTTSWEKPLRATIYPIVADGRGATRDHVAQLARDDFAAIEAFLAREARRYGVTLDDPLRIKLAAPLGALPPLPPAERSLPGTMLWSLRLRWWATGVEWGQPRPRSQVRLFVLYYDPEATRAAAHSLGLKEGLIGVVHAFASRHQTAANNIVIAHELLHTLGATDKYEPASGLPLYPQGYAEPARAPRYPQRKAELMGGRVPIAPRHAEMPDGLHDVLVGPETAREIGWSRK